MQKDRLTIFLLSAICLFSLGFFPAGAEEHKLASPENRVISLEECVNFALENSSVVKLAKLDFLIAEADQGIEEAIFDTRLFADLYFSDDKRESLSIFGPDQTKTNSYSAGLSKKLPSGTELTFSFSDSRAWSNSQYVSQNPAHTAEASLEARQPLAKNFFGQIDRQKISVTNLAIKNADLDTKERIELLVAEVEKAYWQWVYAKKDLDVYRQILEKSKKLHKANIRNYDIGRIERGDFLASKANVLIRESETAIAENKYRQSEESLKLFMNMDPIYRIKPAQGLEYKEIKFTLENSLRTAFQKRRDYQKVTREVMIKNITLKTKANECWPEIDLVATMAANGIDSNFTDASKKIADEDNNYYYAGVEISIPLENKKARGEFKKARHNKEKAIINLKTIERTIITEIGNDFRDYTTYHANLKNLIKASQLQEEKLREEEKRFNYGRSDTKRLIDYQEDNLRAQLQVAQGILNFEKARVNLEKGMNVLLSEYEDKL